MAYKKSTVVISVPLDTETNQQLHMIAKAMKEKSKTRYASRILTGMIALEYKKLLREKKNDSGI